MPCPNGSKHFGHGSKAKFGWVQTNLDLGICRGKSHEFCAQSYYNTCVQNRFGLGTK